MTTDKLDLVREHKDEYAKPKKPVLVDVGAASYLANEGRGAPGGDEFQDRVGALYGMAYTLKFASKSRGRDYKVCPLEGRYWLSGRDSGKPRAFADVPRERWRWQLLIRVPDFVDDSDLADAVETLIDKGKPPAVRDVELLQLEEGTCVQMLHVGPYDEEQRTVDAMLAFAAEAGLEPDGRHHEIYLSDPRRVPPERLRTILRLPVAG